MLLPAVLLLLQAASNAATVPVITITFLMEIIRSPFVRMSR